MRLRWTTRSRHHLLDIFAIISLERPRVAASVLARIRRAAEFLVEFPRAEHQGGVAGTLEWVVRGLPYIIVYEIDEASGEVWILGVFHGARDPDNRD